MSENTTPTTPKRAKTYNPTPEQKAADDASRSLFNTEEEARAKAPFNPRFDLLKVTITREIKPGTYFTYHATPQNGVRNVALALGIEGDTVDAKGRTRKTIATSTPEEIAEGLRAKGVPEALITEMVK